MFNPRLVESGDLEPVDTEFQAVSTERVGGNGLAVKSTRCSSRGSEFRFPAPTLRGSQLYDSSSEVQHPLLSSKGVL